MLLNTTAGYPSNIMSDIVKISYHVYNSLSVNVDLKDLSFEIQLVVQLIYSITAVFVLEIAPAV